MMTAHRLADVEAEVEDGHPAAVGDAQEDADAEEVEDGHPAAVGDAQEDADAEEVEDAEDKVNLNWDPNHATPLHTIRMTNQAKSKVTRPNSSSIT
jgi:hypothetical protein